MKKKKIIIAEMVDMHLSVPKVIYESVDDQPMNGDAFQLHTIYSANHYYWSFETYPSCPFIIITVSSWLAQDGSVDMDDLQCGHYFCILFDSIHV